MMMDHEQSKRNINHRENKVFKRAIRLRLLIASSNLLLALAGERILFL